MIIHPILSPAEVLADPNMHGPTLSDWVRLGQHVRGELPKPWPEIQEMTSDFDWVGKWRDDELIVLDTEYTMPAKIVYQVGFYLLDRGECWIWDRHNPRHMPPWQIYSVLKEVIGTGRIISQNLQAEMSSLYATWKHDFRAWPRVEDTMLMMASLWSELRKGLGFLASLYGEHDKVKHLGPGAYEYLRGDVVETANVYKALRLEFMNDPQAYDHYREALLPLAAILAEHKVRGIDVKTELINEYSARFLGIAESQLLRARAYAGWPINPDSGDQLGMVLSEQEDVYSLAKGSGIRRKRTATGKVSFSKDKIAELVTTLDAKGIDHPLLSSRRDYIDARQLHSLVFKPLLGKRKVFPDVSIHTQATGRWSFTDPPMSLIPADYRGFITVPPGYTLVHGDWSAIEQRILTWLTDDKDEMKVYEAGWDGHILTACMIFGIPYPDDPTPEGYLNDTRWHALWSPTFSGKEDKRRTFAKTFKYRLSYGGSIESAPNIPGAKKLGLTDGQLIDGCYRWLASKPGLAKYWEQTKAAAHAGIVRDLFGRPRRLLNPDLKAREREAMNAPMQSTVATWLNRTVIEVDRQIDRNICHMVQTTHDATYWGVLTEAIDDVTPRLKQIHERPLPIKPGVAISIPWDMEIER